MPRPCTVCRCNRLPDISTDFANGVSDVAIAKKYGLARSSVQRHRAHMGAPNSTATAERKSMAFAALSSLPTANEIGSAYASIGARIDAIAAKAEREGSLVVALTGLRELRQTVEAQARLAGHIGAGSTVNVGIKNEINVDLGAAVKEIIAALKPPASAAIPSELTVHLGDADVTADALARLEAVIDGE